MTPRWAGWTPQNAVRARIWRRRVPPTPTCLPSWTPRSSPCNAPRTLSYSGKKKRHTRKVQIIVNEHGVVREVSDSVPGATHDRELFRQSGAAAAIPKATITGGDAGYQGMQDDLPDHSVITPFKKSKLHPLTEDQQLLNQEFSRTRIIVENVLAQFKHFKALAEHFRHAVDRWDDVFRAVLAIVNPRTLKRLAAAQAA